MASYFMRRGGQLHGPYSSEQLTNAAKSGKLLATDEVAADKKGPWTTAAKLPQLAGLYAAPQTMNAMPANELFDFEEEPAPTQMPFRAYQLPPKSKPTSIKTASKEDRGFFVSLFDWKFDNFIAPALIRALYSLITVLWGLSCIIALVTAEMFLLQAPSISLKPLLMLLAPFLIFVVWIIGQIGYRNAAEISLILFRIEENTR